MAYAPFARYPGGFSPADGTIDFYLRVSALAAPEHCALDLGAGRGAWFVDPASPTSRAIQTLKGKVARVVAADIDAAVLAHPASDAQLVMQDGAVPLDDASVDLVVADYVLEHIDDPAGFAREVDRLLKPGGWFCARTPHKYSYVALAAQLVRNAGHVRVLRGAQPGRKAIDVFPTFYRLNTRAALTRCFPAWGDQSFIFRGDPAYFFGRRWAFEAQALLHRLAPAVFSGSLFVFLRKPPAA